MRTTLVLKDALIKKAKDLTGLTEKTALVHAGLEALISQESRKRLIALKGSDKTARAPERKRIK